METGSKVRRSVLGAPPHAFVWTDASPASCAVAPLSIGRYILYTPSSRASNCTTFAGSTRQMDVCRFVTFIVSTASACEPTDGKYRPCAAYFAYGSASGRWKV